MAMLILLVLLIFFAALGIPLAFAIGASCVNYILIYAPTFITMLPQRVWNGAYSEPVSYTHLVGGMVPPIAIALSTTFCPKKWTADERRNGIVNYVMGLCFVTEGCLLYTSCQIR